jgi:hypothetical protein
MEESHNSNSAHIIITIINIIFIVVVGWVLKQDDGTNVAWKFSKEQTSKHNFPYIISEKQESYEKKNIL